MPFSSERQQKILELLKLDQKLSVSELQEQPGYLDSSIYREIRVLVRERLAEKIPSGLALAEAPAANKGMGQGNCARCGGMVSPRTEFLIQLRTKEERATCRR